jgi:hypothetical protein
MTDSKPETRRLVKARLVPDLYERLDAYAKAHGRSVSNAAEFLIARGLDAQDTKPATPVRRHY